ncbi:MAG: SBBP repeat-containing protein, partial [Methylococcaceae bacterium]
MRNATEMVHFSWTPNKTISNWEVGSKRQSFFAGTLYRGEAYTQGSQQSYSEFYGSVSSTAGGNTSYGNDCSGFVSMNWRLPSRYTTTTFESDATTGGGYVTKLGNIGSGQAIAQALLPGDAFVSSGSHIVLFEQLHYTGAVNDGIYALEQTPHVARRWVWSWSDLSNYRPIRRNKIDEGNYTFVTKWGGPGTLNGLFNWPNGIAVDSSGNVYVTDSGNNRIQKFNSKGGFITKWATPVPPVGIAADLSGNLY